MVRFVGVDYGLPQANLPSEVRFWGITHWLPHSYHPDESYIVTRAVRFHDGDLNPRFFNWPSLYMYLMSGIYGLAYGFGRAVPAFAEDPVAFFLIGRLVTATFGVATVAVLALLAAELYGPTAALLAALFLTLNLLHVRDSHFITTDVPLACLVTLAVLFVIRYWRHGRLRDLLASGLLTGLAASMKYPGGLVLLPLGLAYLLRVDPAGRPVWRRPVWRLVVAREPVVAGLAALAGFLVGTPYALLTPVAFWRGVTSEVREVGSVQFGNEGDLPGYLFHLLHSLPEGMGLPLFGLALLGLALVLVRGGRQAIVLLAFPLPYFAVIGSWSSRFERYTLPLLPFLALLAAVALVAGARWVRERGGGFAARCRPGLALAAVTGLLVAPEVVRMVHYHLLLTRPDTRVLATEWIESAIPSGARLMMEPYSPALHLAHEMVREERRRLAESRGPALLTLRYDRHLAGAGRRDGPSYWVARLRTYNLDRLVEHSVEYVVLSSFMYQRYQRACERYVEPCRFYADLDRRATLVYSIEPTPGLRSLWVGDIYSPLTELAMRTRPGPGIRVYRLPVS